VLATGDRGCFTMTDDCPDGEMVDAGFRKGTPFSSKVEILTDYALCGIGGSVVLGMEFRDLLRRRELQPSDDIVTCWAAAVNAVDELRKRDPDELFPEFTPDGIHAPIRDSVDKRLTLLLIGFQSDGATMLVEFCQREDGVGMFSAVANPDSMECTMGVPTGIELEDVVDDFQLRFLLRPSGAFGHAWYIHHILATGRPDRVTADFQGAMLRWHGAGERPERVTFDFDVNDAEDMRAIAQHLQTNDRVAACIAVEQGDPRKLSDV
jgi:hypothetical protein